MPTLIVILSHRVEPTPETSTGQVQPYLAVTIRQRTSNRGKCNWGVYYWAKPKIKLFHPAYLWWQISNVLVSFHYGTASSSGLWLLPRQDLHLAYISRLGVADHHSPEVLAGYICWHRAIDEWEEWGKKLPRACCRTAQTFRVVKSPNQAVKWGAATQITARTQIPSPTQRSHLCCRKVQETIVCNSI